MRHSDLWRLLESDRCLRLFPTRRIFTWIGNCFRRKRVRGRVSSCLRRARFREWRLRWSSPSPRLDRPEVFVSYLFTRHQTYFCNYNKTVCCGFGSDSHSRKFLLEKILDERRLSRRVLTDEQNHRLRVEIGVIQWRWMEIMKPAVVVNISHFLKYKRRNIGSMWLISHESLFRNSGAKYVGHLGPIG